MVRISNRTPLGRFLLAAVVLLVTLAVLPTTALADRSYSIDKVDIDATVKPDGSVSVIEMREFDFDGSFNGVYWEIPTGSFNGREIETTIEEVGIYEDGEFRPFLQSSLGLDGTYELTEYSSYVRVKLYSAHDDESARFVIRYTDSNLATRYEDTAELYWKFVSDGWDVESQNVTCTIHLPVADGQVVTPEGNVRAWGHGPLDASLVFDGDDVVYTVPGVGTDEFAEARITFPAEWLNGAPVTSGSKLDSILSEEQQWADEANARRERARAVGFGSFGIGAGIAVLTALLSLKKRLSYKAAHKAQFDDRYFRDVPSSDHPAVLGALYRGGNPASEDLTAALMSLTDKGYVRLDKIKIKKKGAFGREKLMEDFRITKLRDVDYGKQDQASVVDRATLKFLDDISELGKKPKGVLDMGDLKKIAKKDSKEYMDAYTDWTSAVGGEAILRGFFEDEKAKGKWWLIMLAVLDFIAAMVLFVLVLEEVIGIVLFLGATAALVAAGVFAIVVAAGMKKLSPEAVELKAQLDALKNWLEDFTRLEEAVPHDVVLWNRLLIMAVVLGVSEKVIAQLKVAAPEVLEDPYIGPVYGWYYYGSRGMGVPVSSFNDALTSAHEVSTAALASSSNSSGGGGGGGFSGGGGGGFGGGGGGGAF